MPAEWEPHAATWFSWPRREGISFPRLFDEVLPAFAAMVRALTPAERVCINVCDAAHEKEARTVLQANGALNERVEIYHHPTDEPWCRDHGPVFLKNQSNHAVVDWEYNAWGGKYPPFENDNAIPARIASLRGLPAFKPNMVLEGGSIEVNGAGALLTTESCLLNPNRNPNLSREEIEQRLRDFLGAKDIHWLGEGIVGDDTDGHVDDLTRFVSADKVVTAVELNPADPNHAALSENRRRLEALPFEVIELPMPPPLHHEGERLPASYANFYIGNEAILLPRFKALTDDVAANILADCFPGRTVAPIDCTALLWGLGACHCITQQEPL